MLVVNVASKCGLTPQYEGMEALYRDYRDKGLVVLGVPCNQFAGQEPGTEGEIKDFCATTLRRRLPADRQGRRQGRRPATRSTPGPRTSSATPAVPVWNFHKILIGADGEADRRVRPPHPAAGPEIVEAVEKAL